ncbi:MULTISPECIES: hypothetical protein [unclassified Pseudomonas]|uniref:hypothetical protein n=1 Tax=unclassified Pseudomonas TaxID=196821 RepID=UPI0035BF1502
MAHLQPFTRAFRVHEADITIHFTFGFHCFTGEKGGGGLILNRGESRYFSRDRWEASKDLRNWISERMLEARVTLHHSAKQRRYFCLDIYDYAMFFQITKPVNTTNELKMPIISAYPLDQWGRSSMPRGKYHNLSWVLSQRAKGIVL